jgi:hypothetical protein
MSNYEFTISLCIRHPTIEPSKISQALGMEPQHTWKAGDPRRSPAGGELEGVYHQSYWTGRLMGEPEISSERVSVNSVLLQIASRLNRSSDFLEQLNAGGGVAELVVSVFAHEDFRLDLSTNSLASLARLRLSVALDIHPHATQNSAPQGN